MSFYYQILKEEKIYKIKLIDNNAIEILHALNELEKTEGIENVLPFYDDIIELILAGFCLNSENINRYYQLYRKTFMHSQIKLSNAIRCFRNDTKYLLGDLYKHLPWYSKLWIKIKKLYTICRSYIRK